MTNCNCECQENCCTTSECDGSECNCICKQDASYDSGLDIDLKIEFIPEFKIHTIFIDRLLVDL